MIKVLCQFCKVFGVLRLPAGQKKIEKKYKKKIYGSLVQRKKTQLIYV